MIAQSLLNELTSFIDGRIDKVVINDVYEITNFKIKEVTANVLALNYIVPMADVSLITKIELKNEHNNVITANEVNIPIVADHLMLQTITVKEAD